MHVGIATTVAVAIHEIAQEISEFFVLRAAGYSLSETLLRNGAVALTILIGIAIGIFFSGAGTATGIILALAAGAFAFVLIQDLIPHSLHHAKHTTSGRATHGVIAALLGIVSMLAIQAITPHSHAPEDTEGHRTGSELHEESGHDH